MYKKIGVSLLALILMFNFTFKDYADAAIATKAAGQAAKQVAKVAIEDMAVQAIGNFALNQAIDIVGEYEAKQGYKAVCPSGAATCDKPIQVKENITDADKQAIRGQAGTELDKLLNNGKGVTKWQKFLDWFLPVWLISFTVTAVTYAFDPEVRSLFDEAGYNTLVALGFIQPLETNEYADFEGKDSGFTAIEFPAGQTQMTGKIAQTRLQTGQGLQQMVKLDNFTETHKKNIAIYANAMNPTTGAYHSMNNASIRLNESWYFYFDNIRRTININTANIIGFKDATVTHNGVQLPTVTGFASQSTVQLNYPASATGMNQFTARMPVLKKDTGLYEMNLYSQPNNIRIQLRFADYTHKPSSLTSVRTEIFYSSSDQKNTTIAVDGTKDIFEKTLVPFYEEIEADKPVTISSYEKDGNIALIPPTALTYKEESTGETVYRVPAAVPTNPPVFQKEDGTPVPEEQITVDPAPTVTPAPNGTTTEKGEPIPEGTPTVTPSPTPSNPAPAPIPLTPSPTPTTPVEPPTTGDPPTTGEPIPEGPGCEEKFKFPILSPLKETFSTAFPFSIPWDIERAINAAFSGIGHEKPKFNLDLNVLGQKETIEITTPKMFDDWKPFTDTLLVLTFDVLIMFGVYRFVKGAGS